MADVATAQRFRFVAEYVILFFGLVGGYALLGSPGSPIPFLVVLAGAAWLYLRREPTFDRDNLWRAGAVRAELPSILRLSAVVAVTMVVAVAVWSPDRLFGFPARSR